MGERLPAFEGCGIRRYLTNKEIPPRNERATGDKRLEQHRFYFRGQVVEVMTRRGAPREEAKETAKLWAKDQGIEDDEETEERESQGRTGGT
jgi:hypothetical protein